MLQQIKYFVGIFLLLLLFQSKAQNAHYVDSLNKTLDTTSSDKLKADIFRELVYEYMYSDVKKAYECGLKSINIAKQINYKHGEIDALNALSIIDKNEGNYSKAFSKLKEAVILCEKYNDSDAESRTYLNIGDVYSQLNDYRKAISNYQKAYEINTAIKDYERCVTNLSRIGNRHMDIGNYEGDTTHIYTAIEFYKKAMDIAEKINNKQKYTLMHINLADAMIILGTKSNNKQTLFYALDYSLRSLKLSREFDLPDLEAISFLNIGETYEKLNYTSKAIHYYEEALKRYEALKSNSWILNCNVFLAKSYYKLNNYNLAIIYAEKAKAIAEKGHLKNKVAETYFLLSEIYKAKNEPLKSLESYKIYTAYKDTLMKEKSAITTARLQTELELERKDKEIELLKQNTEIQNQKIQNQTIQRNFLVAIIVFVLILLIVVLYRYLENKKVQDKIIKAKELAEQAKETQEQFLANTSHEIRTPMNGIVGMTELLSETQLNAEQKEYIDAIKESSNNLLVIINDLLDLSKISAGKMTFDAKPFRLAEQIKTVANSVKNKIAEKQLKLTTEIDESIYPILIGDSTRLNQILLNLVGNAVKFTEKGEIKISVKKIQEFDTKVVLQFDITDTGIGIPVDKINSIFESFTQVDSKKNRKHFGTGLGLTIVKQLVEKQNGTISVKSNVNEGSVFTVILTFIKGLKQQADVAENKSGSGQKAIAANILIVDDNKINQQVAELTLQRWKITTHIASSAKEAFEILKNKPIDLVLMDVTMPEMDGFEATKYIRNNFEKPLSNIPIIAVTASALVGDRERCIAEGMDDYVSKPFDSEELFLKIKKFLPEDKNASLDLSLLIEKADGDNDYMKEIMQTYVDEMPVYLKELLDIYDKNNIKQLAAQAHKMKSPAALLGANKLKQALMEIEKNGLAENRSFDYGSLVKQANNYCLESIELLKEKLKKL
jgi:signal transduction histidine kinase/DNA-binding NarL/FixJ family response regulator